MEGMCLTACVLLEIFSDWEVSVEIEELYLNPGGIVTKPVRVRISTLSIIVHETEVLENFSKTERNHPIKIFFVHLVGRRWQWEESSLKLNGIRGRNRTQRFFSKTMKTVLLQPEKTSLPKLQQILHRREPSEILISSGRSFTHTIGQSSKIERILQNSEASNSKGPLKPKEIYQNWGRSCKTERNISRNWGKCSKWGRPFEEDPSCVIDIGWKEKGIFFKLRSILPKMRKILWERSS